MDIQHNIIYILFITSTKLDVCRTFFMLPNKPV
jgi:hypothetical protein